MHWICRHHRFPPPYEWDIRVSKPNCATYFIQNSLAQPCTTMHFLNSLWWFSAPHQVITRISYETSIVFSIVLPSSLKNLCINITKLIAKALLNATVQKHFDYFKVSVVRIGLECPSQEPVGVKLHKRRYVCVLEASYLKHVFKCFCSSWECSLWELRVWLQSRLSERDSEHKGRMRYLLVYTVTQ